MFDINVGLYHRRTRIFMNSWLLQDKGTGATHSNLWRESEYDLHGELWWVDVRVADHELLQDVVLDSPLKLFHSNLWRESEYDLHGELWWVDVRVADHELLQDVVLDSPLKLFQLDSMCAGQGEGQSSQREGKKIIYVYTLIMLHVANKINANYFYTHHFLQCNLEYRPLCKCCHEHFLWWKILAGVYSYTPDPE